MNPADYIWAQVYGRQLEAFCRGSVPMARKLIRQGNDLARIANYQSQTGRIVPATAAGIGLTQALALHEIAVQRYQLVMARVQQAWALALAAGKTSESSIRFTTLGPSGAMQGLGALPPMLIVVVAIIAGFFASVSSGVVALLVNRDEVIRATGEATNNATLVEAFNANAAAYMKANPAAPPPDPPMTQTVVKDTGGIFANIAPLLTIGAGLWALSMLPKGGAK